MNKLTNITRVKIPTHRLDPRPTRPTNLDAFERRLRRLADGTKRADFSSERFVFDFHLAQKAPRKAYWAPDVKRKQNWADFQRNAGTSESVAVLDFENYVFNLSEYCLRLDHPVDDYTNKRELRREVASLVEDVVPPPNTEVSIRSQRKPMLALGFPEYFTKPTPHIFREEGDSHPTVLLDFIAEFMPEYRARFL